MENKMNFKEKAAKAECSLHANLPNEVISVRSLIAKNQVFVHSKKY